MNSLQTFVNDILKKDCEFLQNEIQQLNTLYQDGHDFCAKVLNEIKKYDKTGNFSAVDPPLGNNSSSASKRSSTKENTAPSQNLIAKQDNAKPKRNAFRETNQTPEQQPDILSKVKIKAERVSKESHPQPEITPISSTVAVKTENVDMPAPTQLPPRKKKIKTEPTATKPRSTRTKTKAIESDTADSSDEARPKRTRKKPVRYESEEKRKDSDVILQSTPVTTVELSDSEDGISTTSEKIPESSTTKNKKVEEVSETKNTRSTRTKTKNKAGDSSSSDQSQQKLTSQKTKSTATKRGRLESSDEEFNTQKNKERETKRSKSNSDHDESNSLDKTDKPQSTTVSHQTNKNKNDNFDKDLFTDDESDIEYKTPPQRSNSKNNKKVENNLTKSGDKNKLQEDAAMLDTTMVIEKPKYTETTLKTLVSDKGSNPTSVLNATVVIEKGVTNNTGKGACNPENALLTDDESEEEIIRSPLKPQVKKNQAKGIKPIFSPFDPSPVKKKVEAFERLGAEASAIPTRVTRTKTRAQVKEHKENNNTAEIDNTEDHRDATRSVVKEKAKFFTPTISKFLPKSSSTNKLTHKLPVNGMNLSTCNESILSVKSASALKSSQAEYRERERQRREKETEALRKRELMIQAQIEEKKRKREEKQLKAQQHREVLEKEAQKKLEVQRIKEEKYKKMIAEKEEKLQKQREELERKRLLAKKRAIEEKKKEEQRQAEEQKKLDELKMREKALKMQQGEEQPQPIYLRMKAPLLPTDDCYDSDDPEFKTHRPKEPNWAKEENLRVVQLCMIAARDNLKNTFFCRQATTPDLQELFEYIDPRKLKRTSSAIWRKPPRYTLMPLIEQDLVENSSEDDY